MDPLTHGVLGAAIGHCCFGRRLGTSAMVVGAVVAMCPDLDLVYGSVQGPFARLVTHRGVTHSLFFGPVAGSVLGWLIWRRRKARDFGAGAGPLTWIGLCVLALLSHPMLDVFTSYGTQLLAPFSRARFALHAVPIVDSAFSLILAAGLIGGVLVRNRDKSAWFTGAAIVFSAGYLVLGLRVNGLAEAEARRQLEAEGIENAEVHAFPTMLQLPQRRLIALTPTEARVGFISMWRPCPIRWGVARRVTNADTRALAATTQGKIYAWFSGGLLIPRIYLENQRPVIDLVDLRYGFEADPLRSMWGIRGYFDADGQLLGTPQRFNNRPKVTREAIAQLFADAFPGDCKAIVE